MFLESQDDLRNQTNIKFFKSLRDTDEICLPRAETARHYVMCFVLRQDLSTLPRLVLNSGYFCFSSEY